MMGFDAPYVPGWDCHGLPIEQSGRQEARLEEAGHERGRDPPGLPRLRARSSSTSSATSSAASASAACGTALTRRWIFRTRPRSLWPSVASTRRDLRLPGSEVGAVVLHRPHGARRGGARVRGARGPGDLRRVPDGPLRSPAIASPNPRFSSGRRRRGRSPPTSRSPSTPRRPTPWSTRRPHYVVAERLAASVAAAPGWSHWKPVATLPGIAARRAFDTGIRFRRMPRRADGRGGRARPSASCSATT